jgi:hypothetical protein
MTKHLIQLILIEVDVYRAAREVTKVESDVRVGLSSWSSVLNVLRGLRYRKYWISADRQQVLSLKSGPKKEAVEFTRGG